MCSHFVPCNALSLVLARCSVFPVAPGFCISVQIGGLLSSKVGLFIGLLLCLQGGFLCLGKQNMVLDG